MPIRTNKQLATILAIRQEANERDIKNGHSLPLSALPVNSARNWQSRVHIALRELGFSTSRECRNNFLSELFGRRIQSVNELSWPECNAFCAAVYIDTMNKDLRSIANEYVLQ